MLRTAYRRACWIRLTALPFCHRSRNLPSELVAVMGRGVMTCRWGKDFKGKWGAPTMMALEGGSVGLQLGGEATDFVLLLMTSNSASSLCLAVVASHKTQAT